MKQNVVAEFWLERATQSVALFAVVGCVGWCAMSCLRKAPAPAASRVVV